MDQKAFKFVANRPIPVEETRYYEFKEIKGANPANSIKNTCDEYVVSFLNSEGGRILWGVRNSDRCAVGVRLDPTERDQLRRVVTDKLLQIRPPIAPTAYRITLHPLYIEETSSECVADMFVVEIVAPRAQAGALYATSGGEVFVRTDSGKKKLTIEEIQDEIRRRQADNQSRLAAEEISFPGALPPIRNMPHRYNRNFTERENLQGKKLHQALTSGHLVAMYGLGGTGKTQLAVKYAYEYAQEYGVVWWMRAENPTVLGIDYAGLAQKLDPQQKEVRKETIVIAAVRRWLEQRSGWLLVFDNAQEPTAVRDYLPRSQTGHVLITSRNPNWRGIAQPVEVKEFERTESITFLLKRTGQADEAAANALANALGDLPLALEQAGAYIDASQISLTEYLDRFQSYHQELLSKERPIDYPDTVATTWEISFQQVQQQSPGGAALLHLCAFLAPDDIPQDLLRMEGQGLPEELAATVTNLLAFDDAIMSLRRYSLIKKNGDALTIHRLVQAVLRDRLTEEERQTWIETSLYLMCRALERARNEERAPSTYTRLVPHALVVAEHVKSLSDTPEQRLDLLLALGPALMSIKGFTAPEVKDIYRQALELCQQAGKISKTVQALWGNWQSDYASAGSQAANEAEEQFLDLAQRVQNPSAILIAYRSARGASLFSSGEFTSARTHIAEGLRLYDPQQHAVLLEGEDPEVGFRGLEAGLLWLLGYPDQALTQIQKALSWVEELHSFHTSAIGHAYAAYLYQFRRELPAVQEQREKLERLRTEQGVRTYQYVELLWQGWELTTQGQVEQGIARIRQGLDGCQNSKLEGPLPYGSALLAEAYGAKGQAEEGLRVLDEALVRVDNNNKRWWVAELHRLKGELLLKLTVPDEQQAEACFHDALAETRRQQAKSLELRAAVSLSRLWKQQGKWEKARDLLIPVYDWFTEGFDTRDLQEAEALLEALGG